MSHDKIYLSDLTKPRLRRYPITEPQTNQSTQVNQEDALKAAKERAELLEFIKRNSALTDQLKDQYDSLVLENKNMMEYYNNAIDEALKAKLMAEAARKEAEDRLTAAMSVANQLDKKIDDVEARYKKKEAQDINDKFARLSSGKSSVKKK